MKHDLIRWLNMYDGGSCEAGSILRLYQQFSHLETRIAETEYRIMMNPGDKFHVKVPDLTGWTDVMYIRRYIAERWIKIIVGDSSIMLEDRELIPVYDPDKHMTGFHGELKYPYILKSPDNLTKDDHIRLIVDKDNQFVIPEVEKEESVLWSYQIVTKSGFMNAGEFHIHANDHITIEEAKSWSDHCQLCFK